MTEEQCHTSSCLLLYFASRGFNVIPTMKIKDALINHKEERVNIIDCNT